MRLLVTGGAGFIGSHFVKRMLEAGEDVVVLDKFTYAGNAANLPPEVDCQRGDIAVREDVDRVGAVDAIVNFAAETHVDRSIHGPEDFVRTDVLGTLVLLQVARDLSARFVQVSPTRSSGTSSRAGRRARTIRCGRRARTARRRPAATSRCWPVCAPSV